MRLLEPFGNRVTRADSMAEAVERAGKDRFDAIIAGAGDADMLAAAPGVKAPLVAVLLRGDRAPAATDVVLRWPVEPNQLYRALNAIQPARAPETDEPDDAELPAAIDAVAFSSLEKSVGVKTLVEILQCYIVTAEQLTNALADACAEEKWDEAGTAGAGYCRRRRRAGPDRHHPGGAAFRPGGARRREPPRPAQRRPDGGGRTCAGAEGAGPSLSRRCLNSEHGRRIRLRFCEDARTVIIPRPCPLVLDNLIALVPAPPGAAIYRRAGDESERIELRDARALFEGGDVLVAHAAFVAGRLGTRATVMLFDVLELFAFVRPGMPFVPSALGLARALGLALPHTPEESAAALARYRPRAACGSGRLAASRARSAGAAGRHPGTRRLALGAAAEGDRREKRRTARPSPGWKPGAA